MKIATIRRTMLSALPKLIMFGSLFLCMRLHAEISVGYSLEWLADTSGIIVVYEVTTSRPKDETRFFMGDARYDRYVRTYDLQFRLIGNWKGDAPTELRWEYSIHSTGKIDETRAPREHDQFLAFLKRSEDDAKIAPERINRPVTLINLRAPATEGHEIVAMTADFNVLTDGNRVIDVVRRRLRDHPTSESLPFGRLPQENWIEVPPFASDVYRVLSAGSAVYLLVPTDVQVQSKKAQQHRNP